MLRFTQESTNRNSRFRATRRLVPKRGSSGAHGPKMLVQVGRRYVSEQREIDPTFAKGMKDLLSKSKVFQDCHDEFIRDLIVSANRKEYAINRYLMEEGSRGDSMFVLFKGCVEVTACGRYVCKLRDGSIVGEAALLNIDNRRTASVRSVQKCDVAIIFRSIFHSILEKYPWEKRKFQREMKGKLMELGKLIDVKDDINLEQQAAQCDALKKVPFFAQDDSLHDFVAELAMNASSYWYKPGRKIIQEGDRKCDEMYVLLRGAVVITACGQFLGRLENDLFGEICVLDLLDRRTATVTTATQCHCMMFRREVVVPVLAKYPDARMRLLEHARQRLVALNDAINTDAAVTDGMEIGMQRLEGCAIGFGSAIPACDAHLFAASSLFQDSRLELLRALCDRFETKTFQERETIIQEGTPFLPDRDFVYFIAEGTVEVWKADHFISHLRDGDVFGDLAAFADNSKVAVRQATVVCKTRVVTRTVVGTVLLSVLDTYRDDYLLEMWAAARQKMADQLSAKESLRHQMRQIHVDSLDIMFMKLPVVANPADGAIGTRVPKIEALQDAVIDACKATLCGQNNVLALAAE